MNFKATIATLLSAAVGGTFVFTDASVAQVANTPPASYEVVCTYPLSTCSIPPDSVGDTGSLIQIVPIPDQINALRDRIGMTLMGVTTTCPSPNSTIPDNSVGDVLPDISQYCPEPERIPKCADGVDNDGDGKIDYPEDPGCTSATDQSESDAAPAPACSDGVDNDLDGLIDYPADGGCSASNDTDETDPAGTTCTSTKGALVGMGWSSSQSYNDAIVGGTVYRTWQTEASILGLTRTTYLDSAGEACGQSYLAQRLVLRGSTSPNSEYRNTDGIPAPVAALHHGSNETCEIGVGIQQTVTVGTDPTYQAPPKAVGARSLHYILIDNTYYGPGVQEDGDTSGGIDIRQDDVDVPPVTTCAASPPPQQGGQVAFSSTTYAHAESGTVTVTVTRSGGADGVATVQYQTDPSGGTATAGTDYVATSGTLTWDNGQSGDRWFTISIASDTLNEPDETVRVSLFNATTASLGSPNTATVTIIDDDEPRGDDCLPGQICP